MAEEAKKNEAATTIARDQRIGLRLVPSGNSDVALFANLARVQPAPPAVLIDFGFIEPGALNAVARSARGGGKLPEAVSGRLITRVALSPDAVVTLHEQLGRVVAGMRGKGSDAKAN